MKNLICEVDQHHKLYRDSETGIAWMEDHSTGLGISVHANISDTGNVEGMRGRGHWGRNDRVVKSHGWYYNIDTLVCDLSNPNERLVAEACMCDSCRNRGIQVGGFVKNIVTGEYDLMSYRSSMRSDGTVVSDGEVIRQAMKDAEVRNFMNASGDVYDANDVVVRRRFITASNWR